MEEQIGLDTTHAAVSTPHTTLVNDQGKRVCFFKQYFDTHSFDNNNLKPSTQQSGRSKSI